MAELVKDGTGKIAAAIEESITVVHDRASLIKEAAEQAQAGLPGHLNKLNDAAAQLSAELEGVWQHVRRIEIPPDLLQKKLAPTLKILARLLTLFVLLLAFGAAYEREKAASSIIPRLKMKFEPYGRKCQVA